MVWLGRVGHLRIRFVSVCQWKEGVTRFCFWPSLLRKIKLYWYCLWVSVIEWFTQLSLMQCFTTSPTNVRITSHWNICSITMSDSDCDWYFRVSLTGYTMSMFRRRPSKPENGDTCEDVDEEFRNLQSGWLTKKRFVSISVLLSVRFVTM